MTKPRFRQLPAYIATGAKRDVWQYIVEDVESTGEEWTYFGVKSLPETIQARYGRSYHQGTISRALRDLAEEQYIVYRSGTRGQVSMAHPVPASPDNEANAPQPHRGGA